MKAYYYDVKIGSSVVGWSNNDPKRVKGVLMDKVYPGKYSHGYCIYPEKEIGPADEVAVCVQHIEEIKNDRIN